MEGRAVGKGGVVVVEEAEENELPADPPTPTTALPVEDGGTLGMCPGSPAAFTPTWRGAR